MGARWSDRYWKSSDGLRLHYREYAGSDPYLPILCLHGLTRNGRDFEDFAEGQAGRRVIVPDFRGRGASAWDPEPARYALPVYARDILDLLDALGIERCILVGTSLGGLVTMAVACAEPERVAAAVLNDVGPELNRAGLERIAGYVGKPGHFTNWDDAAAAVAKASAAAHPGYSAADWLRMARRLCVKTSSGIAFDYDPAIAINFRAGLDAPPFDAWPMYRALRCPVLILRGELSDLLSAPVARRMAAESELAELVTVAGVGHAPDLSENDALASVQRLLLRAV